ncbi:MAG: hypothetical protein U0587_00395 [Candidatus Binatia bacterium]
MSSEQARDQRGSILVESLVALGLFAITAAGIGQLLLQHIRAQGTNGTNTMAITLATRELEDMRAREYGDMVGSSSNVTTGSLTFSVQTTVVADSPEPNLKSIATSVSWTEPNGPQAYTMYAIYSDVTR